MGDTKAKGQFKEGETEIIEYFKNLKNITEDEVQGFRITMVSFKAYRKRRAL
jgi:hypothetical protein